MLKYLYLFISFTYLLFGMSDKELARIIDLSGKERMLTQKMSKEALLIYIGIDVDKNVKNLKNSSFKFNQILNGLLEGNKTLGLVKSNNKDIEKKLKEVKNLWIPFYEKIKSVYSFNGLNDKTFKYIDKNNLPLLKKMNEVVTLYTKLGDGNKLKMANDINLAGKQRMLTQMIAKDLLLYQANINPKKALSLKNSIALFDKTLKGLYNGDKDLNLIGTKLPKIRKQLDIVKSKWQDTKPLISKAIKEKDNQDLTKKVIASLDNVKEEMNKAVILYTKSLNRQKQVMKLNEIINSYTIKKSNRKHLINVAGKQRMLTQRLSKLAIECKFNLMSNSCKKLKTYSNLYNKTLIGFIKGDSDLNISPVKSKEAIKQIEKITTLWKKFYKNIQTIQKNPQSIDFILKNNNKLLDESNRLVKILRDINNSSLSFIEKAQLKIVDIAGRERMLSQKMTKELLESIEFNNKKAKESMNKTIELFSNSLDGLINGSNAMGLPKATNPKIKKQLLKVKNIWQKIEPFYKKSNLSKKELVLLLKANPILLKEMDRGVKIIEQSTDY